ncbi:MAG: type II secretion system protein [Luteolibacter sp.]
MRPPLHAPAMTLLELTVVISVMLALVSILFIGAKSWKKGSDRAGCVMNIRNIQHAVRGYQNVKEYGVGETLSGNDAGKSLLEIINDEGYLSDSLYHIATGENPCPGNGTCGCSITDRFPQIGTLFMNCSLADSAMHAPQQYSDW